MVTLEAIDTANDKLLWQTNLTEPANDLIAVQSAISQQVRPEAASRARREQAALSIPARVRATRPPTTCTCTAWLCPTIPRPTRMPSWCWSMRCRAIPNYAPAWEELGLRQYYDSSYSDGGEEMFQRSTQSYERAVALDPNRIVAAGQLITNRVERGELGKAYESAQALVQRRPDSAEAHFVLSYVYRYAGILQEATTGM